MRGCPPQTPPVGQGRTPGTRLGCAGLGGEGGNGGGERWRWRCEGGRVEVDVEGERVEWRWRWMWRCMIFYASSFFNLSRMSLIRDCWEAMVASRLETWFSNSAMRALSACCCRSTSWSAAVATIAIDSLFNIL